MTIITGHGTHISGGHAVHQSVVRAIVSAEHVAKLADHWAHIVLAELN